MASRNNAKTETPTDDLIDDLPDEINDEDSHASTTSNGSGYSYSAGLSLEELDAIGIDEERDERERAKIDPPSGNWEKEAKFTYEKRVNTNDRGQGDIDPAGRTMLNFYGKPVSREVNNIVYEPTLFIRLSPDLRYKADKPTEHDQAYKLWLAAKDLFLSMYARRPKISEIVKMMEQDHYIIRTMKGDSGPITVGIQDADQERIRSNRRNRRNKVAQDN